MADKPSKLKMQALQMARALCGPVLYEKIRGKQYLGYWPNIKTPATFNEKVMHMKLFKTPENASVLSDKYAVRKFVEERIGSQYLNGLYFAGPDAAQIDFDKLPQKFIAKTNNGCEGNIIVHDKDSVNQDDMREKLTSFLKQKFGYDTNESWYLNIKPLIIIEELMEDKNGNIPDDYKFFCFHGKCKFIQINKDRFTGHKIIYLNERWEKEPVRLWHYSNDGEVEKPANADEMMRLAETLAAGLEFVRVDLYSYNGNIRFGEMTFAPNAGLKPFIPESFDRELGAYW